MRTPVYVAALSGRGRPAVTRHETPRGRFGAGRHWGGVAVGVIGGLVATGGLSLGGGRWIWAALVVALLVGAVAVARGDIPTR